MHFLVQKCDEFQSYIFNIRPEKWLCIYFPMIIYYTYVNIPVYTLFGNCCILFLLYVHVYATWRFQYLKGL